MFGPSKVERLYEARIEDLKKEHDRTIQSLVAWIEQLQAQVGAVRTTPGPGANIPAPMPEVNMAMYLGEEEESVLDAFANDLITQEQMEAALAEIGMRNKVVTD